MRHFETERLCGGEIDHEIEFNRLLDWDIAGFRSRAESCQLPWLSRRVGINLGSWVRTIPMRHCRLAQNRE